MGPHQRIHVLFLLLPLQLASLVGVLVAEGDWINGGAVAVDGQLGALAVQLLGVGLPILHLLVVAILELPESSFPFDCEIPLPGAIVLLFLFLDIPFLLVYTGMVPLKPLQSCIDVALQST